MDDLLRNKTFDQLQPGDTASIERLVARDDLDLFAAVSGDVNPAHLDGAFAAANQFSHVVAHGMWTAALISAVLGTKLPGPGTIYLGQDLQFIKPVALGDTVTATVIVKEKQAQKSIVTLDTVCTNQRNEEVLRGVATVVAPERNVEWPRMRLPDVTLRRHDRFDSFIKKARAAEPVCAAIVHPCSASAIMGALEARNEGLLNPILVGPGITRWFGDRAGRAQPCRRRTCCRTRGDREGVGAGQG